MKKLLFITLAAYLALSLTGCNTDPVEIAEEQPEDVSTRANEWYIHTYTLAEHVFRIHMVPGFPDGISKAQVRYKWNGMVYYYNPDEGKFSNSPYNVDWFIYPNPGPYSDIGRIETLPQYFPKGSNWEFQCRGLSSNGTDLTGWSQWSTQAIFNNIWGW